MTVIHIQYVISIICLSKVTDDWQHAQTNNVHFHIIGRIIECHKKKHIIKINTVTLSWGYGTFFVHSYSIMINRRLEANSVQMFRRSFLGIVLGILVSYVKNIMARFTTYTYISLLHEHFKKSWLPIYITNSTHTCTHAHKRERAQTHTHTLTHMHTLFFLIFLCFQTLNRN